MSKDELERVAEIDRSEVIEHVHHFREGKLDLVEEYWNVPRWTPEEQQHFIRALHGIHYRGGMVIGAFDGSSIAGIIALDSEFIGTDRDQLNLAGLWVSNQWRKKGVATALVEMVKDKAREMGAKKLYVSATPSRNTVDFYRSRGFKLAEEINEKLFELEPEDIHMELTL